MADNVQTDRKTNRKSSRYFLSFSLFLFLTKILYSTGLEELIPVGNPGAFQSVNLFLPDCRKEFYRDLESLISERAIASEAYFKSFQEFMKLSLSPDLLAQSQMQATRKVLGLKSGQSVGADRVHEAVKSAENSSDLRRYFIEASLQRWIRAMGLSEFIFSNRRFPSQTSQEYWQTTLNRLVPYRATFNHRWNFEDFYPTLLSETGRDQAEILGGINHLIASQDLSSWQKATLLTHVVYLAFINNSSSDGLESFRVITPDVLPLEIAGIARLIPFLSQSNQSLSDKTNLRLDVWGLGIPPPIDQSHEDSELEEADDRGELFYNSLVSGAVDGVVIRLSRRFSADIGRASSDGRTRWIHFMSDLLSKLDRKVEDSDSFVQRPINELRLTIDESFSSFSFLRDLWRDLMQSLDELSDGSAVSPFTLVIEGDFDIASDGFWLFFQSLQKNTDEDPFSDSQTHSRNVRFILNPDKILHLLSGYVDRPDGIDRLSYFFEECDRLDWDVEISSRRKVLKRDHQIWKDIRDIFRQSRDGAKSVAVLRFFLRQFLGSSENLDVFAVMDELLHLQVKESSGFGLDTEFADGLGRKSSQSKLALQIRALRNRLEYGLNFEEDFLTHSLEPLRGKVTRSLQEVLFDAGLKDAATERWIYRIFGLPAPIGLYAKGAYQICSRFFAVSKPFLGIPK